jgi:hypothetical protein
MHQRAPSAPMEEEHNEWDQDFLQLQEHITNNLR